LADAGTRQNNIPDACQQPRMVVRGPVEDANPILQRLNRCGGCFAIAAGNAVKITKTNCSTDSISKYTLFSAKYRQRDCEFSNKIEKMFELMLHTIN